MESKRAIQLKKANDYAALKSGRCLSLEYINSKEKLEWKCNVIEHASWHATYDGVVNGKSWCPICGNQKQSRKNSLSDGLNKSRAAAILKGGSCLSLDYINAKKPLEWKCAVIEHPSWYANYDSIANAKQWCPMCKKDAISDKKRNPHGLKNAIELAKSRNGQCLSSTYKNNNTPMEWQCAMKHPIWHSTYGSVVVAGTWCPECGKTNVSETRTRIIFETFFGQPFPSSRPYWNLNPWTEKLLELDGYCETFNIAFEYDGEHHYDKKAYGKERKGRDLTYQIFRDTQKKKNCLVNDVTLINIPHVDKSKANKFNHFLDHVCHHTSSQGLIMFFNEFQLKDMEQKFNQVA